MVPSPDWQLIELRFTLHALAQEAELALATQSEISDRPSELALSFGEALLAALERCNTFSAAQIAAMNAVAELLRQMSAAMDAQLWTESAVHYHPAWNQVRSLARNALRELEWDAE